MSDPIMKYFEVKLMCRADDYQITGQTNTVTSLKLRTRVVYVVRDSGMLRRFRQNILGSLLSKASNALERMLGFEPETELENGTLVRDPNGAPASVRDDYGSRTEEETLGSVGGRVPSLAQKINPFPSKSPERILDSNRSGMVTKQINATAALYAGLARFTLNVQIGFLSGKAQEKEGQKIEEILKEISETKFDFPEVCLGIVLEYSMTYVEGSWWYNIYWGGWVSGKDRAAVAASLKSLLYGPTISARDPWKPSEMFYRIIEHYPKTQENSIENNFGDR